MKNREAGDRRQPDTQNKRDGNKVGMVEELRDRARLRWKGGVRTTRQDAEWIREVYDCISQGIKQRPWSLAVSRDGKNLNSLNYLDRSRKNSSLHRLSLR